MKDEKKYIENLINKIGLIGQYVNGNYNVYLLKDGTKIRETIDSNETIFKPEFAENCDFQITNVCDAGCKYCYTGALKDGNHPNLRNLKFLDTLHPYTELAINGNDLSHPDLDWLLNKLKEKKVVANVTVNQFHFIKLYDKLKSYVDNGLIYGVGVSLNSNCKLDDDFIEKVKSFKNAVIHVICGIVTEEELDKLKGLKVLFLGYKKTGRGESFFERYEAEIMKKINSIDLKKYFSYFSCITFDNLALDQLKVKDHVSSEMWDLHFMGDDGNFTFYIDAVKNKFYQDSTQTEGFEMMSDVDEMFNVIRENKRRF